MKTKKPKQKHLKAILNASKHLVAYKTVPELKEDLQLLFRSRLEHYPEDYERFGTSFFQLSNFLEEISKNKKVLKYLEREDVVL